MVFPMPVGFLQNLLTIPFEIVNRFSVRRQCVCGPFAPEVQRQRRIVCLRVLGKPGGEFVGHLPHWCELPAPQQRDAFAQHIEHHLVLQGVG